MSPSDKFLGARPTAREYHGVSSLGDGPPCPTPGHGRTLLLTHGPWCPHQSHDVERLTPAATVTEGPVELPALDIGELNA